MNVISFTVKSLAEVAGLPCMKNLGLVIAQMNLKETGEYTYHDSESGQKYKITLSK